MRLVLVLFAAALGYVALMHSLAMVVQKQSSDRAHALAPSNGFITGKLSSELSGPDATSQDRVQADRLARLALRQDPTAIDAVTALGLNAQIRGDIPSARRLFTYAQALSRRSLQAELWAIDDSVTRDDLPAILKHFDIALRTSPISSSLLFPILTTAISEPEIRAALAKTLVKTPPWANAFMTYIVDNGADPETTASLFQTVLHLGGAIPGPDSAGLINVLIGAEKFDQAWAYYASHHPNASRHLSRDPAFEGHPQSPSLFDWNPINDGGISASIQPDGSHGSVLTFTAPPSIGGPVIQQVELLPPGDYILDGRGEGIDQADDSRPYWSLTCRGGSELGRVGVPNSIGKSSLFRGRFTIPSDCPVQVLALNVRPSSKLSGVSGQIDRALLHPLGK